MKIQCLILGLLTIVAIMVICIMVKFSTDIKEEKIIAEFKEKPDKPPTLRSLSVISIAPNDNSSIAMAERFPYTAAILRNASHTWTFACFASVILVKWLVTTAHCRKAGSIHRALVYYDYVYNYSRTYPIIIWRIHENFDKIHSPKYDIALAKLNIKDYFPFTMKPALVYDGSAKEEEEVIASVWKTVASMDSKHYLTNDFVKYDLKFAQKHRCYESYGIVLDDSMFCVDMSDYDDCFIHEFGPIYDGNRVIGVASIKPRECDSKLAIFTNVSWYAGWIIKSTGTGKLKLNDSRPL